MRRLPQASLLMLVALLMSACGTHRSYSGPPQPRPQVALLHSAPALNSQVILERINGHSLRPWQLRVELLPGAQLIVATALIRAPARLVRRSHTLRLSAEAGATYTMHADWHLYGPRIRVLDQDGNVAAEAVTRPPS